MKLGRWDGAEPVGGRRHGAKSRSRVRHVRDSSRGPSRQETRLFLARTSRRAEMFSAAHGPRVDQLYGRTCGNGLPQLLDVVGFADKWRRQIDSGSVSAMGVRGQDIGNAAQNEPV